MSEDKKNCGLARDLMPLSLDGICSESSQRFLDDHLKTCDKCRAAFDKTRGVPTEQTLIPQEEAASEEQKALASSVKKTARKMKIRRWLILLLIPVLILAALSGYSRVNIYRQNAREPLAMRNYDIRLSTHGQYLFVDVGIYNAPGAYRGTRIDFEIINVETEKGPVRAALVTLSPQVSPYIQWNYDDFYVYSHNVNTADPVFCYLEGGIYTINTLNHRYAVDIPGVESREQECSIEIGVPVAVITVTDGENYGVLYTWGDELPAKNMEMLSTVNPYDPWNELSNAKLLNPGALFDANKALPVSGGMLHAGMNPMPITATPVPNAQEIAQGLALREIQASPMATVTPQNTSTATITPDATETPESTNTPEGE